MQNKKVRVLTANAIIMALYVALSFISPFPSGAIQFRMSESLNHLVVFNRKMLWGVFGGVLMFNLFFGEGPLDVVFGGAQTLLALLATAALEKKVANVKLRLAFNVLFFTVSMFMIAVMLSVTAHLPFWMTYLTTALSELIIMSISAPVMYYINEKLDFAKKI